MTAVLEFRSVFDSTQQALIEGLREITDPLIQDLPPHAEAASASEGVVLQSLEESNSEVGRGNESGPVGEVSDRMFCSACQCSFDSREEQMEHYKLDWHRFNLRQRLAGRPPATVDEFEKKTGAGDMSSISGSDSEDGESDSDLGFHGDESPLETESSPCRLSSKVVFKNTPGQYLTVHRCVLQSKKLGSEGDLVASLLSITSKTVWVILMTGGGHFAGAVFQGREILQHKTFHRYTVRAKRGTAQGLRDSQNRSHAPKSAGAALRRHNEAALVKEIQDLLESWSEHLEEASAIFLRAPSYNKTTFFGGRAAPFDKKDCRIRTLPFATRRATFREIKRVHDVLSTVHVYGKDTEVSSIVSQSKKVWKKAVAPKSATHVNPDQETEEAEEEGSSGEDGSVQLETEEVTLGTLHLREHEIYSSRRRRRRRKEKHRGEREGSTSRDADEQTEDLVATPTEQADGQETQGKARGRRNPRAKRPQPEEDGADVSWEYGLRDALFTACKTGDHATLCSLLRLPDQPGNGGGERGDPEGLPPEANAAAGPGEQDDPENRAHEGNAAASPLSLLNKPVDSSGFTLLHVASAAGQKGVVRLLMDVGSDPACRDKKGQTPYGVAPEKDTRNTFRKYMADHPDKYDYTKAQVPGPLTLEIESKKAEKKKAQKAAKKQREKELKEEKQNKEMEQDERRRFAALSDREKRALAAEKRLAEQIATTGAPLTNIRRCWQCGESLLGKVPFEYLDFSFCTPRCLQTHRKAGTTAAKP